MPTYVDTSALLALSVPTDQYHKAATAYLSGAMKGGTRFIVGRPVVVEYVDGVTKRAGKKEAIERLHDLETSTLMRVEVETPEDHTRAREIFLRYDDQEIDLTDSLSFAMMERLHMDEVFSFDRDFETHGFRRVPVDRRR